jgi:ketosteroid isomerase-like protein
MSEQADSEGAALDAVKAWNAAWMAQDIARMKEIASDDFIQWHATIRKDLTKAEEFAMLEKAIEFLKTRFEDIRLTPLSGGAVLQQCLATVSIEGVGTAEKVPFAMVYRTRDGKITRCDEYMDGMSLPRFDFAPG